MIRAFIIALIFTVSVGFFGCQADAPEPAAPSTEDRPSQPSPAPRFSRTPPEISRSAAALGEHTDEALTDWGFAKSEIAKLREQAAIA